MRLKTNRAAQLLLSLVTGISVLAMSSAPRAFAASPIAGYTVNSPEFSAPVLTPASRRQPPGKTRSPMRWRIITPINP
jgi:hypothetical protein